MWVWLSACKPDPGAIALTIELSQPTEVAPLVRLLHAEADEPVTLEATWTSPDHAVSTTFAAGPAVQDHLLLGMRPGQTYTLTVTATADGGMSGTAEAEFTTVDVDRHFPRAEILPGTGIREPGDTLIPMHSFIVDTEPNDLAAIWDEEGNLVYWLDTGDFLYDVEPYEGGLLALVGTENTRLIQYAWDGTEVANWGMGADLAADVLVPSKEASGFHHDAGAARFEPDQFLGLGRRPADVDAYPVDYDNPNLLVPRKDVALDSIVSFDAQGTLLDELRIDELIPVTHIGYDSLSTTVEGWADWAHANAVIEDEDGHWIVSLRHLDCVIKVDKDTHELMWILGNHENWPVDLQSKLLQPIGELRWQYHQHGPELAPRGPNGEIELLLFDNGNGQASPYTGVKPLDNPISRVVQFEIDEPAMTVRQIFAFERPGGGRLYSEAVGNADPLANGNALSAWGFLATLPDGTLNGDAGLGLRSVRIIEIDPATVAEVETLYLTTPVADNDKGWTGYRAERIPDLEGRVVD